MSRAILAVAIIAGMTFNPPPPVTSQESKPEAKQAPKPSETETQLLKQLLELYTLGLSEVCTAHERFWAGLKRGPGEEGLWSEIADFKCLKFANEAKFAGMGKDAGGLSKPVINDLKNQLMELTQK